MYAKNKLSLKVKTLGAAFVALYSMNSSAGFWDAGQQAQNDLHSLNCSAQAAAAANEIEPSSRLPRGLAWLDKRRSKRKRQAGLPRAATPTVQFAADWLECMATQEPPAPPKPEVVQEGMDFLNNEMEYIEEWHEFECSTSVWEHINDKPTSESKEYRVRVVIKNDCEGVILGKEDATYHVVVESSAEFRTKIDLKDANMGATVDASAASLGVVVYGGHGDDIIIGSRRSDRIYGNGGNDDIKGNNTGDFIFGGDGDDTIEGGDGNDWIEGGDGDDTLSGGWHSDTILGNDGNDWIDGGTERDALYGGDGDDEIYGRLGKDSIWGNEGNDEIYGGEDGDSIDGGDGNDTIDGGDGNDSIWGKGGDDTISGGAGLDQIYGGWGTDQVAQWY